MKQSESKRPFAASLFLGAAALVLAACSAGDPIAPDEPSSASMEASVDGTSNGLSEASKAAPETLATPEPRTEAAAPSALPQDPATEPMTAETPNEPEAAAAPTELTEPSMEIATLGAGCFWCIEAVLEQLDGVESVVSGYMGGQTLNPTYKQICTGQTGHAEVVQVTFDPSILSYQELLDWFWKSHDPTTLNRQGNDVGTQYRSAIFVHSPEQRVIAETSRKDVQPTFPSPIVTEVTDATAFYEAEDYHQGYYFDNTRQGYCRAIIAPKLKKLGLKY